MLLLQKASSPLLDSLSSQVCNAFNWKGMVQGGGFHLCLAVLRSTNSLLSHCAACPVLPKDGMMRDQQSVSCAPAA